MSHNGCRSCLLSCLCSLPSTYGTYYFVLFLPVDNPDARQPVSVLILHPINRESMAPPVFSVERRGTTDEEGADIRYAWARVLVEGSWVEDLDECLIFHFPNRGIHPFIFLFLFHVLYARILRTYGGRYAQS